MHSPMRAAQAFLFALACATTSPVQAGFVYVDASATGDNSGVSWEHAYTDLQSALADSNGDAGNQYEIRVAAGTYTPGTSRTSTFRIYRDNVQLFGGFPPGGGEWEDRDWVAHETILSGDINQDGNLDGNAYRVMWVDGSSSKNISSNTIIDGFTITAGNANSSNFPYDRGAGIYCDGDDGECSPILRNLVVSGHSADDGGGMYMTAFDGIVSPMLTNASFIDNVAVDFFGGGIWIITDAGVASPVMKDVSFEGNSSGRWGGGMYLSVQSGLGPGSGTPELTNVVFMGNTAVLSGGGVSFQSFSGSDLQPILTNVTFTGNSAENAFGGGLYFEAHDQASNSLVLTNTTFVGNSASDGGGIGNYVHVDANDGDPQIHNSVFWDNGGGSIFNDGSVPDVRHSLMEGCNPDGNWQAACGSDGGNNVADADPMFVNPPSSVQAPLVGGDVRLLADSPAIDQGDDSLNSLDFDLDWNQRIMGAAIDLGAYEHVFVECPDDTGILHVDRQATGAGDGLTWATAFRELRDALALSEACEIRLAAGTYLPTDDPSQRQARFTIRYDGTQLYGGFPPAGGAWTDRDIHRWATRLSGDIDQDGDLEHNSHHVVWLAGSTDGAITASTVVDGVVITAGNADAASPHDEGGGLVCWGGGNNNECSPSLNNVIFTGNSAANRGGGMVSRGVNGGRSDPLLTNVLFNNNHAGIQGGGLFNHGQYGQSSPTLTNVTFHGNTASVGGGMRTRSPDYDPDTGPSRPEVRNSLFWNNEGGSISNLGGEPVVSHSLVEGCNLEGTWKGDCGEDGGGNVADSPPLFADVNDGDFRLLPGSPAAFVGDELIALSATDLAGEPRTVAGMIDLGAYQNPGFSLSLDPSAQAALPYESYEAIQVTVTARGDTGFSDWNSYPLAGGNVLMTYPESGATVMLQGTDDNPLALTIDSDGLAETPTSVPTGQEGTFEIDFLLPVDQTASAQMHNLALHLVSVNLSGEGNVEPQQQEVATGENAQFTLAPASGWQLVSVEGNSCQPQDEGGGEWVIENLTDHCQVEAIFEVDQYVVTATVVGGNGAISPSSQSVDHGKAATFWPVPFPDYQVASVAGDTCTPVEADDGEWVAEGITADCEVTAEFEPEVVDEVFNDRFQSQEQVQ